MNGLHLKILARAERKGVIVTRKLTFLLAVLLPCVAQGAQPRALAVAPPAGAANEVWLDDRESHSWSYYSDPASPVRSLNPADVKITYYGYGANTMYSSNAATPTGSPDVNVAASSVGIGIDAPGKNTFVYLKTLERINGEQASSMAAADGPCRYVTIPNPFSIRPTHGSGAGRWRGFYKWRVKRLAGGRVYGDKGMSRSLSASSMLDAEDTLYFMPTGEYGMEVEFEAVWARAFVFDSVGSGVGLNSTALTASDYASGANAYERNFVVLTRNGRFTAMPTRPATITAVYPDGTDGVSSARLAARPEGVVVNRGMSFLADTKFEYIKITGGYNSYYIGGNYVTFGRGLKNADGTLISYYLMGISGNASTTTRVRLRMESGDFGMMWFTGSRRTHSGAVYFRATMGTDYDRSVGDHTKLSLGMIMGGDQCSFGPANRGIDQYNYVVKSGRFIPDDDLGGAHGGTEAFYMGSSCGDSRDLNHQGTRTMTIEGGVFNSIACGMDMDRQAYVDSAQTMVRLRMKGGLVRGCLYGAAEHAEARGNRRLVVTGGTINGWMAGGVNGTIQNYAGNLTGDTYIYFGGRARLEHVASDPKIASSYGGNIYGAGSGNENDTGYASTVGRVLNSTIVIADSCYVSRNVYGGGNHGYIHGTGASIHLLGGTVEGKVFGGSNKQKGKAVDILMRGGTVKGGVYGGSNIVGLVTGPVSIRLEGGTVGEPGCADTVGNVFGCGYGENTQVTGDVNIVVGRAEAKYPHVDTPRIHGSIYGGGYWGDYDATGKLFGITTYNGRIDRDIFGGGYGSTAVITGNTSVRVLGTTSVHGNVYGGGNMGAVKGNTNVVIGD